MGRKETRSTILDPREPVLLSAVTILVCLVEGAGVTYVLLELRDSLARVTSVLGGWTAQGSAYTLQRWGFPLASDNPWGVSVTIEQVWMAVVTSAAVFLLFGVVIGAREATRYLLDATYTSSGPFRRRKAATLNRLDQLLN